MVFVQKTKTHSGCKKLPLDVCSLKGACVLNFFKLPPQSFSGSPGTCTVSQDSRLVRLQACDTSPGHRGLLEEPWRVCVCVCVRACGVCVCVCVCVCARVRVRPLPLKFTYFFSIGTEFIFNVVLLLGVRYANCSPCISFQVCFSIQVVREGRAESLMLDTWSSWLLSVC